MKQEKPTPLRLNVHNVLTRPQVYHDGFGLTFRGRAKNGAGISYEVTLKFYGRWFLKVLLDTVKSVIKTKMTRKQEEVDYYADLLKP